MTTPFVSVVVPARNAAGTLGECLSALGRQDWPRGALEIVCVDDGSRDGTPEIAARLADRVVRLPGAGPAAARNAGARAASGELLVFLDADVVAPGSTVSGLVRPLVEDSDLHATFGSYDAAPRHAAFVSVYRNLLHHYVHQTSRTEAETFWAGCGAIRRQAFERAGGFDSRRYRRPSIEDIELGRRMRAAGMRIRLIPGVQVKHLKGWTLAQVLRTDVAARGIPWARLLLEGRSGSEAAAGGGARPGSSGDARRSLGDLNLTLAAVASAPLAWGALVALPAATRAPRAAAWSFVMAGAALALNAPLTAYFWRARGGRFAIATLPLQFLYHLGNGASVAFVVAERVAQSARRALRTVAPEPPARVG